MSNAANVVKKIVIVTGANKGIGFEIARKVAKSSHCILAARNEELGRAAAAKLVGEGLDVEFEQLDITEAQSIDSFIARFTKKYPRLDVLVNNAGIADTREDFGLKEALATFNCNYHGTKNLTLALLPSLLAAEAPRVVNVCSSVGKLHAFSPALQSLVLDRVKNADQRGLDELVHRFLARIKDNSNAEDGWPEPNGFNTYSASKLLEIAHTKILAKQQPKIVVTAVCPGYCDTDMTAGRGAPRTAEKGAETPAWLALTDDQAALVSGEFYLDLEPTAW